MNRGALPCPKNLRFLGYLLLKDLQTKLLFELQLNQAATCGVGDCFGAADDIELGEDAFHMRLHGAFTNK